MIKQIRTDSLSTLKFFNQDLEENGIVFDLEKETVVLDGIKYSLSEKALSLVFLLAVNHSCSFTFHQLYEAIWHEVVRSDSQGLVLDLIKEVNTQAQTQLVRVIVKNQSEETRIQLSWHF